MTKLVSMSSWLTLVLLGLGSGVAEANSDKPNVIYILSDEIAYFEPGFMGGELIDTPNLDQMAAEGIVFRHLLSGAPACAPARATLMTGRHLGRTSVRDNQGDTPIRADEETIASILKREGYATGGFGKWGLGGRGSSGVPEKHGFDVFFGYYHQVHAHTFFPPYLIKNSEEVPLPGNDVVGFRRSGETYAHYEIHEAAMDFIREHAGERPFFAYLPYTPPHGPFAIPESDPARAKYKDKAWPTDARLYAAMTTMLDRHVGEIRELLKEKGVAENTLVFFSGDNGADDRFADKENPRGLFSGNKDPHSDLEYRGGKGNLYQGALRVPFVAVWPGRIQPGRVSDFLGYFPDVLPTIAEVAGAKTPSDATGISFVPALIGEEAAGREQAQHVYLYWEFRRGRVVRQGKWRAVHPTRKGASWELYDVSKDPSESNNLAEVRPEVLARLRALVEEAREPVRGGTWKNRELNERDRRAKFGRHDQET